MSGSRGFAPLDEIITDDDSDCDDNGDEMAGFAYVDQRTWRHWAWRWISGVASWIGLGGR